MKKEVNGIVSGIIGQSSGVLTEIYKDAIQPAVQPIGQLISYPTRLIRLAFSPLEKWLIGSEESLRLAVNMVAEKTDRLPEDKIAPLEPNIAIPAVMQLSYCENSSDIRNLYANLLATSMNADRKWTVHPAYVEIIKQLTPDEAKYLGALPPNSNIPHPLINVKHSKKNGFTSVMSNFTDEYVNVLEYPMQISSYLCNLARLGLISISERSFIANNEIYSRIKKSTLLIEILSQKGLGQLEGLAYEKRLFNLTDFGAGFVMVCCHG